MLVVSFYYKNHMRSAGLQDLVSASLEKNKIFLFPDTLQLTYGSSVVVL